MRYLPSRRTNTRANHCCSGLPVHGELKDHAAIGVWYNPRQCFRHRYESRAIGETDPSTAGSGRRPASPACVRWPRNVSQEGPPESESGPPCTPQDTANHIFVDLDAESQRDLLSNARTAPVRIAPFHGYDGVDEVFLRSLRARATPALGRKQEAVFSFPQHRVVMQQVGRLQNDGGTANTGRAHERVHKPAMIRSVAFRLGARLRPRLRTSS